MVSIFDFDLLFDPDREAWGKGNRFQLANAEHLSRNSGHRKLAILGVRKNVDLEVYLRSE